MDQLLRDVTCGFRAMVRRPVSSLASASALALGLAASALAWTLIDAAILNPFGLPAGDELVVLRETDAARREQLIEVSLPNFHDWQREARTVSSLAAFGSSHWPTLARIGDETISLAVRAVTTAFFPTLGAAPVLGRGFAATDVSNVAPPPVVLSHRLWHSRWGGSPDVVGRTLVLDGSHHTIVGVMPRGFAFPDDPDVWVSVERVLAAAFDGVPEPQQRMIGVLDVLGRRQRGATNGDVERELTGIASALWLRHRSEPRQAAVVVTPFADVIMGRLGARLWIALAMAIAVLLFACANVAAVRLAELRERAGELAARLCLGATRRRLARQLALESLGLAAAAAVIAPVVWLALLTIMAESTVIADSGVQLADYGRAAALTIGLLLVVVWILVGLVPALLSARLDIAGARLGAGRTVPRSSRIGAPLLFAQAAGAVVVVAVAAAALQAFERLSRSDVGFATDRVTLVDVGLPDWKYPAASDRGRVVERLQREIAAIPGVRQAAAASIRPFRFGEIVDGLPVRRGGDALVGVSDAISGSRVVTTPEYFGAIGQPILEGRTFTAFDRTDTPRVAIVSRTMARALWGDEPAVGKSIETYSLGEQWTRRLVVGIAGDARYRSFTRPSLEVFIPHTQAAADLGSLIVSTGDEAMLSAATLRAALGRVDPDLALERVQTAGELVQTVLSPARLVATVVGMLGLAGLLLLALGIFGATAAALGAASVEIAVRQALGATALRAVRAPLTTFGRALLLGLAVGLPLAPVALGAATAFGIDASATGFALAAAGAAVCVAALLATAPSLWQASRRSPAELFREV